MNKSLKNFKITKHFYWDPLYLGNGNGQRNEWYRAALSLSLPPSHKDLAGLKPTDHPSSASWYCTVVHTTHAVTNKTND